MGKRGVIRQLFSSWRRQPGAPTPAHPRRGTVENLEQRRLLSAAVINAVWGGRDIQVVQGEYVVEFQPGANVNKVAAEFQNLQRIGTSNFYSLSTVKTIPQMETWVKNRPASAIAVTPNIVTQFADIALPNDPFINGQYHHYNTGQVIPDPLFDPNGTLLFSTGGGPGLVDADVDTAEAWTIVRGDPNFGDPTKQIIVAVLDSGIDLNHPDLASHVWKNPGEIPGNQFDDDGNGFVDDVNGWDFANGDNDPTDDNGHGTHVSGIVGAAGNNSAGISGVIQSVKILPVKAGSQTLTTIDIINSIEYVTTLKNQGYNIVAANGSFGGTNFPFNRVYNDAIARMSQAGTLFVVAAGNDSLDVDPAPDFPGKFSLSQPNVITVAATDNKDQIAFFSNIGAATVNIAAPGLNILSTFPTYPVGTLLETGEIIASHPLNYGYESGTSMASPVVAGAIALMKAAKPDASMMELKQALLTGADKIPALNRPIPAGDPLVSTAGRLNVHKAILNLLNQRTNVDTDTRGSWAGGAYGREGAVVYGETGGVDTYTNSFATAQVTGASLQIVNDTTSNPDALQQSFNRQNRIGAQLTSAGPITLDLEIRDGKSHRVSLYMADLINNSRAQTITLVDPDSGVAIASYSTGNLQTGEYATFEVNPPSTPAPDGTYRVRMVISPAAGSNAVLNGLFFDPAATNDAALVTSTPVAGVTPTLTGGDWRRQFGSAGARVFGTNVNKFPVPLTVSRGTQVAKPQFNSSDAALINPRSPNGGRVAGYLQSRNHVDLRLNLSRYGRPQKLTLYAADFEKAGRAQRVEVFDDSTGALLSSVHMTDLAAGKYVSWVLSGKVRIRVTRLAGPSAVVGGLFLDAAPGAPVEYVGMDVNSSGNWTTYYGADASFVFGSPKTPVRKNFYTENLKYGRQQFETGFRVQTVSLRVTNGAASPPNNVYSDDPRFPVTESATDNRRHANAKVTGNSMNLDFNFSDARSHRIALYMVDPDARGARAQRVDIQLVDRETGKARTVASQLVTNFSKGKYVVFNARQTDPNAAVDVRVKITRVAGQSAVVNAAFIE
jgi:subtilisin family serine protease